MTTASAPFRIGVTEITRAIAVTVDNPDATMPTSYAGALFRVTTATIEWTRSEWPNRVTDWTWNLRGWGHSIKADGTPGKAPRQGSLWRRDNPPAWVQAIVDATRPQS